MDERERRERRRDRMRVYMREYRRRNPDKQLQWRLNAAQRLLNRMTVAQTGAGPDRAGDGL